MPLEGIQRTSEYTPKELKRLANELARDYTPKGKLVNYRLRVTNNGATLLASVDVKGNTAPVERSMAL